MTVIFLTFIFLTFRDLITDYDPLERLRFDPLRLGSGQALSGILFPVLKDGRGLTPIEWVKNKRGRIQSSPSLHPVRDDTPLELLTGFTSFSEPIINSIRNQGPFHGRDPFRVPFHDHRPSYDHDRPSCGRRPFPNLAANSGSVQV